MSKKRPLTSAFTFFLIFCFPSILTVGQTGDWPCWRGPNRDGKSPDTGLLKEWPEGGPELLWHADGLGEGYSTVAVSGGFIYTTGDIEEKLILSALDMNGEHAWKVPVDKTWTKDKPGARSTPTVHSGRVYILSGNGVLACLDAKTGNQYWSKDLTSLGGKPSRWGYAESVLIYKNLAIAKPGGGNCIVAFDKVSGNIVWQSKNYEADPEYGSCVPFTFNNIPMIATGTRGGIVCVSPDTGDLFWSNDWCRNNVANCPDPAYADGYIFWANGYNKGGICLKLDISNGKVSAERAWTTRDMVCHHGGYIIHEGYIYGNHNNGWSCIELKTGDLKWNEKGVGKGSLCFADGMLYLFGENGGKAALATCSPEGLEIKGTTAVQGSGPSWAHPVVIGGRLYLRYADNLYCFNVKAK
jgi:outer membrane protein assembly factor BamB